MFWIPYEQIFPIAKAQRRGNS